MRKVIQKFNTSKLVASMLAVVFLFALNSCNNDDDIDMGTQPTQDIVELAIANGYNTLAAALQAAGLADALRGAGPFTLFAPTDAAFGAAGITPSNVADIPNLAAILQFHVVPAKVESSQLNSGAVATLLGSELTIDAQNRTVNGIAIINPLDLRGTNGIIHSINGLLIPENNSEEPTLVSAVELASLVENLSTLVAAVSKFSDLVAALSNESGNFTIFAPTNAAFTALLQAVGQQSLDDLPESVLRRILSYHVVSGAGVRSGDLTNGQSVATLLGDNLRVNISANGIAINNANVVNADVLASNAVIHIVDAVLIPELEQSIVNTVVEPAYFNKNFSVLTEAVVKAGLLETLTNRSANFTVFAPTNEAFAAAGITSLNGLTASDLTPILTYHVLGSRVLSTALPATGSAVTTLGGDFYLSVNSSGVFINGTTKVLATDITAENGVVHVIDRTLLPPTKNIVEIAVEAASAASGAQFGQLVAALTRVTNDAEGADLIGTLSQSTGAFTVFAPTDAAFQALYTALGVSGVNDIPVSTLQAVLLYHVVGARVFSTDLPNLPSTTVTSLGGQFTLNLSDLTIDDTGSETNAAIVGTNILATNGVIHVIDKVILP